MTELVGLVRVLKFPELFVLEYSKIIYATAKQW